MAVSNKVQLITYPDSLGGDLRTLQHTLEQYFVDLFPGGIHILPPFPSSGDRGFAPLTYLEIEPACGTWEDIRRIGEKRDILLDLMVNHISARSEYFQDFLRQGRKSGYAELFITLEKVWPGGDPPPEDVEKIFLRRTEPFSEFTIKGTGEVERVWTTFGKVMPSEQIDLDVHSDVTRGLLADFLSNFSQNGVKIVRLDAIGYVIKKAGTSCFFVEPEIYDFLDWLRELARSLGLEVLPEVHAHHTTQKKLAERGYWIYDFILPYRVLEALIFRTSRYLCHYLRERPSKQFTMLDCHDGVPIKPDLNDLYDSEMAKELVARCLERGANLSLIFSPKHRDPDGFDVHQIRGTYYSLLDGDDEAYLAARAIQFFTPGVPQVYYVGLLAGENDYAGAERSGEGRDINRHNFHLEEIEEAVKKDVVQRLLWLIRFRNSYPAFGGSFSVAETKEHEMKLEWNNGAQQCMLSLDLKTYRSLITYLDDHGEVVEFRV
jgi:sucrose phosphorylase